MKTYLLPKEGNFYKANLHVHTTISDGTLSPEEVKKAYAEHGYSIIAFTDHEVFVPQNDLTDENFLALNAVEISVNDDFEGEYMHKKTFHLNFYAKSSEQKECIASTGYTIWLEQSKPYVSEFTKNNNLKKEHNVESINNMIKKANDDGFFVCYNHPVWSLHNFSDYSGLKGLWGIEVFNTGCEKGGYYETVQPFEDLLRENQKLVPVCADDSHSLWSAFGGWTMVKANDLTYDSVVSALVDGNCYSSTGPEIKELYIEDGIVHVTTSPATHIKLVTDLRVTKSKLAPDNSFITEAQFDINSFIETAKDKTIKRRSLPWFRIEVKDERGQHAYTKAFFIDDLDL